MWFILVSLLISVQTASATTDGWLEAIARGQDAKAADIFEDYYERLPKKPYDSSFANLVKKTAEHLRAGFDCPERKKVTVYRRLQVGRTDVNLPSGKMKIVLPARAFMTKDKEFKSTGLNSTISEWPLDSMKKAHSHPFYGDEKKYRNSYLISTAKKDGVDEGDLVPTYTVEAAILRVCPERTIPGRVGEGEVLLPFFIHPNEVVAVIEMIDNRKFKILYRGLGQSEAETRKAIYRLAGVKAKVCEDQL